MYRLYIVDFSGNVPRAISLKDSISMSAITGDTGDLIVKPPSCQYVSELNWKYMVCTGNVNSFT